MRAAWPPRTILWTLIGSVGTSLVALDALASSHLPRGPLRMVEAVLPWLRHGGWVGAAHLGALVGSLALFAAWLALRPGTDPGARAGLRTPVLGILALWCIPLLLAPPVMTADPYAYAAQGWLLATGRDPYEVPMGVRGPFAEGVYFMWRPTTAVYPPYALLLQEGVVRLTGAHPWWSVVAMRAIALLGLAIMAVATVLLARQLKVSTRLALWGTVLNPLVVVQLIGGAHNDTMMIGLVMLALWAARRHGLIAGAVMVGVAAMFKQPAVLAGIGVVLISLPDELRRRPVRWAAIAGRLVLGGAIGGAVFAVLSLLSGLGFGWLGDGAGSPSLVINQTPLSWLAQAARVRNVSPGVIDASLTIVSTILMVACIAWVLRRFALDRPVLTTAGILLAFGLLGSAVQPWYPLWGGPLLALAGLTRRSERLACAGVLLFLVSGALQGMPSPVVSVPLGALIALCWWRFAPSRRSDAEPVHEDADTRVG
ncbi:polyprenol phosphomannose-dependent alpha 1,6 mannosyltransferase MptB [Mariniluteicoccus flavus]